jgi:hypothetical protein
VGFVSNFAQQVAKILTDVLGKQVTHKDLTPAELEARLQSFGVPEDYSRMMSSLDTAIKHGSEDRTNDVVLALTGKLPKTFKDWAESSKAVWL